MKFVVFSSGSKGNCSALITNAGIILIDCGISFAKIKKAMGQYSLNLEDITHCIITHEHTDHVSGLKVLTKNNPNIQIIWTYGTQVAYEQKFKHTMTQIQSISPDSQITVNNVNLDFFPTTHDARESIGFCIYQEDKKFSYLTDCGVISSHIIKELEKTTHLALESNYCPQMLENGRYPDFLKERVSGPKGHLSNDQASKLLQIFNENLEYVCLMHLSENNNNPTAAFNKCKQALKLETFLCIASQNNGANMINL